MWSKPVESGTKNQKSTRTENKNSEEATKNRQKANKNKSRNRNNKYSSASDDLKSKKDELNAKTATKDNIDEDVVLRKKSEALIRHLENPSNRFSDGFANENIIEDNLVTSTPLTRTLSGFFNVEEAKRSRRFSDLFRPGSDKYPEFKTGLNCKSLDCDDATTSRKDNEKNKNSKKSENVPASKKVEPSKRGSTKSAATPKEPQDSYLKRVKSRIYKSKSDDTAKIELDNKRKAKKAVDLNGRIPEESIVTTVNARRPLSNLLTRQTTNLEYISRPFGSRKSLGITENTVEKPVLTKAKSSSAINLNLLRTRRAKIMEQAASLQSAASKVCNEFDYIAFGGLQSDRLHGSTTSLRKFPSWLHISREEPEDSHPVTLSVSNREFDSDDSRQMDEVDASMDNQEEKVESPKTPKHVEQKEESIIPEISISHENENKKTTTTISRSESLKEQQSEKKKQRRNVSDPLQNNSSSLTVYAKDSDSDTEEKDDHFWEELISAEELNKLPPNERRRQDVINEFFHTETSHVQMLKVLYKLFYKRLQESRILKPDELSLIFPNIKELLDVHSEMEREMKHIKKENPLESNIGDMLLTLFGGEKGERLKTASATFCERQQLALDLIKRRRERDSKFNTLLAETEKERKCRRLQLQSIVPCEMQRLVKYPLLLERLIKSVDTGGEHADEIAKLRLAHSHSKNVLNQVNEAAKAAHNKHRLEEIQKHLDTTSFKDSNHKIVKEFRNIDLTSYNLVLEGNMQLRRPNKAPTNVHVLLLEELVLILQKDNDKFILKFFNSGSPTSQLPFSPIIKLNNLLVRKNAVVKEALFLVNMSANNSQMYDLMAEDESKRDIWLKQFSEATDVYNKKRRTLDLDDTEMEEFLDLPIPADREKSIDNISVSSFDSDKKDTISSISSNSETNLSTRSTSNNDIASVHGSDNISAIKVDVEDWPLIQPSQVTTIVPPVCTAEPLLTPLEELIRKNALIQETLIEKENLIFNMLSTPRGSLHDDILPKVSSREITDHTDQTGLTSIIDKILISVLEVNKLQKAVNEALNVSEEDLNKQGEDKVIPNSIPASLVKTVANSLSLQLTSLLTDLKHLEEERSKESFCTDDRMEVPEDVRTDDDTED